ncbi:uncharacterized protein LOC129767358 [Toxorhynchites rutilus septentrionalis]|uniref:uncharacterized protein LOC129767358 n=1 Tax=Toxorhynchites rutilus septentrionalis TaxID=329112 RepID=UPI0024799BEF|nr:uncharacterized protein LOC129767358 [Toxorhynchites rutilus septentrionalis]
MDISCMPNEVLCRIFDLLPWSNRKRISLVCSRWNEIVNSDRYLRQTKLVLYNYSKVQFFSGVEEELLNKQKVIEFHSSAMLDTKELLLTVAQSFPSGEAAVECIDLFLRSDHEQLFNLVISNLPKLTWLKSLRILANEALKAYKDGLPIHSAILEKLKLTFYQNTPCILITPRLRSLDMVIRHANDMNVLRGVSGQLRELTVNFQSKDLLVELFLCSFENLEKLHLSIENDKYLPYIVSPSAAITWDDIQICTGSIGNLRCLEVVDKCNMLRHNYLKVFVYAKELTHLTVNYIHLDSMVVDFITTFRNLQYLNLRGCSTTGEPLILDLPNLRELLMPYKHYSMLPCTNLNHLRTLSYSSSQKNHAHFVQKITKTFTNLETLNLLNFDYELSSDSFKHLDELKFLKTLTIRDMSVSNQIFARCPLLSTLRKLELKTVVTEISLLTYLPLKMPHLYKLNIENCFFYIISNDHSSEHLSFGKLRERMPRCRVSTVDSTVFTNEHYDQNPIYIPG